MASTSILENIASLEKELARLKTALTEGGSISVKKVKKAKKERDPDAPPPKENPYFTFLNDRLRPLLKEAKADLKLAGTIPVSFAKHLATLKETKEEVYSMEDEDILAAFDEWATPETLAPPPRKAKSVASEAPSDTESTVGEAKAEKPKRVLSEEQKAKMKAGREAAKAKKDAEAAAAAPAEVKEEKPAEEKKALKKKEVKKTYTLKELQNWDDIFMYEGEQYAKNPRGDVITDEGDFVGVWEKDHINRSAPKPADWDTVMP